MARRSPLARGVAISRRLNCTTSCRNHPASQTHAIGSAMTKECAVTFGVSMGLFALVSTPGKQY